MTYANIQKAARLLDYAPKVPLEEGVERFVKWYCGCYGKKEQA